MRDQIIVYAINNHMGFEYTQGILKEYKMPVLYSRVRRDTIFIWALYHKQEIDVVNQLIEKYGCEPLANPKATSY